MKSPDRPVRTWESDFNEEAGTWDRAQSTYRTPPPTSEPGRYVVYGSHACPWATRVKMLLLMMGLEEVVKIIDCDPVFGVIHEETQQTGWVFSEEFPDTLNRQSSLKDLYFLGNPSHSSKSTTPMLWDAHACKVLHNESFDMALLLHDAFRQRATREVDLYPRHLREAIHGLYQEYYEPLLNGVYRAGFASKQEVLDEAVAQIFSSLDGLEQRLSGQRWMLGQRFTFADVIFFPTLWRFDPIYHVHFKCSLRRIRDYPALSNYVREIYSWPVVREANQLEPSQKHYYASHYNINPSRLVARVDISWMDAPHNRSALAQEEPLWFMA